MEGGGSGNPDDGSGGRGDGIKFMLPSFLSVVLLLVIVAYCIVRCKKCHGGDHEEPQDGKKKSRTKG